MKQISLSELDASLADLLKHLDRAEDYPAAKNLAEKIIQDYEDDGKEFAINRKLLRKGSKLFWKQTGYVAWGWFYGPWQDVDAFDDEKWEALFEVFEAIVPFAADMSFRLARNAKELRDRLRSYLSLRGFTEDENKCITSQGLSDNGKDVPLLPAETAESQKTPLVAEKLEENYVDSISGRVQREFLRAVNGKGNVQIEAILQHVYGSKNKSNLAALLKAKNRINGKLANDNPNLELRQAGETMVLAAV
jgi:hypothetical protein